MVRLVLFAIIYALICVLLFMALKLAMPDLGEALALAGYTYALVFLPGIVIAFMDFALERFAHQNRLFWASIAGLCLLPALFYVFLPERGFGAREIVLLGAVGALSAICCWLLVGWTHQKLQARS